MRLFAMDFATTTVSLEPTIRASKAYFSPIYLLTATKAPRVTDSWWSPFPLRARLISEYELIGEDGPLYREWCVPADIINRDGTVRLLNEEEAEEAEEEGSKEKWRRYKLVPGG